MHTRGGYIYCRSPCTVGAERARQRFPCWARSALNQGEYLFGNVESRVSTLKSREAVSIEKSTWWHKQLWGEFITRPRWLPMTYFGCFPWQSSERGEREREMTAGDWGWKQTMKRLLLLPRSFSTSSDSKEREKRRRSKRGTVLVKGRERMEREGAEVEEKVTERKSKRGMWPGLYFISV